MDCSECGKDVILVKRTKVPYDGIRVANVYLWNCEVEVCPHCGVESPVVRHIKKVHSMIAFAIALQPAKLSGVELRFLRRTLRLTVAEWSARIGIASESFSRWENGRSPSQQVEKLTRIDFLTSISKDLSIDLVLQDVVSDVLSAELKDKRDFALVIDMEDLDARPAYASLRSSEFAMPSFAYIEAPVMSSVRLAHVRIYGGGKILVAQPQDISSEENSDACYALAAAA